MMLRRHREQLIKAQQTKEQTKTTAEGKTEKTAKKSVKK